MPWKAGASLPGGYTLLERVDLVRNRAHLKRVVCLSVGLAGAALLAGFCFAPAGGNAGTVTVGSFIVKLLTAAAGLALYMAGHEAVHGLAMWAAGRVKPHFGFTLMYAYAGSDAFFSKNAYLCIALAPAAVWGIGLALGCALVPSDWFWVVYAAQVFNLSGSAGDFYVAARVLRMPGGVLVRDTGTAMMAFSPMQTAADA